MPPSEDIDSPAAPPPARRSRLRVLIFRGIGVLAVGLATAGVFLPLLPTTVFLLIAVWAFAQGSPELADKLRAHKRFGPILVRWEERGAIPTGAKVAAVIMMAISWTILALGVHSLWVTVGVGALLIGVAGYIVSRPSS